MRLGAPIFNFDSPETWIEKVQQAGYRAVYCPIDHTVDSVTIGAYEQIAKRHDVVIAEVGAWSNPISPNDDERRQAITYCQQQLALADEIGALCCVNIAGSCYPTIWDAPHQENMTEATFDLIVETVRTIIDAVKPTRTFYTLEMMPYTYPDTVDNYLKIIRAIDRETFAVHLDPVNLINSPTAYFNNTKIIEDAFRQLGSFIKSCHAKDIQMALQAPIHFDEVIPCTGNLDYATYLNCLNNLDHPVPMMVEHLPPEDYPKAVQHIRQKAQTLGIPLT